MFETFKIWLGKLAIVLVAFATAYRQGRNDATARLKQDEAERRLKNLKTAKEIRDEVANMGDDELVAAASKWLRKPDAE